MELDLDQVDLAAGEEAPEPKSLKYRGQSFALVDDVPVLELKPVVAALGDLKDVVVTEDVEAIVDIVGRILPVFFADGEWDRFRAARPGIRALTRVATGIAEMYGFGGLGESSASSDSSPNTGDGSKLTSDASTGSAPVEPSSDPTAWEPESSET